LTWGEQRRARRRRRLLPEICLGFWWLWGPCQETQRISRAAGPPQRIAAVCMCMRMCVCVCVCVCVYVCVCICICYMNMSQFVGRRSAPADSSCVCVYVYVCVRTCMCLCTWVCKLYVIHLWMCLCMLWGPYRESRFWMTLRSISKVTENLAGCQSASANGSYKREYKEACVCVCVCMCILYV